MSVRPATHWLSAIAVGLIVLSAPPDVRGQSGPDSPAKPGVDSSGSVRVAAAASPALELQKLTDAARRPPAAEGRATAEQTSSVPMVSTIAAGLLVLALVAAGITLTVIGLRDDLRRRKRSYRRRSRRIHARNRPAERRATSS